MNLKLARYEFNTYPQIKQPQNKTERLGFHSESTLISESIQSEDQVQSVVKDKTSVNLTDLLCKHTLVSWSATIKK